MSSYTCPPSCDEGHFVMHYWACDGNCGGTCSPDAVETYVQRATSDDGLRDRLRDWIEDVHECGPEEQMTDEHLTDLLILFVQQEIARARGGAS